MDWLRPARIVRLLAELRPELLALELFVLELLERGRPVQLLERERPAQEWLEPDRQHSPAAVLAAEPARLSFAEIAVQSAERDHLESQLFAPASGQRLRYRAPVQLFR